MRQIKFRGFTPIKMFQNAKGVKPKWVFGFYEEYPKGQHIIVTENQDRFVCDEESIGQFCGLTDKNGKEIYEGDIVKGKTYRYGYELDRTKGKQFDYEGQVEWFAEDIHLGWHIVNKDGGGIPLGETTHRNSCYLITGEVIGNIYETPELIK